MKPKRLKVYARLGLISTKLSLVKDLIEIVIHTYIARLEQYENGSGRYTVTLGRTGVKPRHM